MVLIHIVVNKSYFNYFTLPLLSFSYTVEQKTFKGQIFVPLANMHRKLSQLHQSFLILIIVSENLWTEHSRLKNKPQIPFTFCHLDILHYTVINDLLLANTWLHC